MHKAHMTLTIPRTKASHGRKRSVLGVSVLLAALCLLPGAMAAAADLPQKPVKPLPDLVPATWVVSPPCGTDCWLCLPMQVAVGVKNQSAQAAAGVITIEVREVYTGQVFYRMRVNGVPGGGQVAIGYTIAFPSCFPMPSLPANMRIVVDTANTVAELNENNNSRDMFLSAFVPLSAPRKDVPVLQFQQ